MAGVRRTWDREVYAAKAKERLEIGDSIEGKSEGKKERYLKEEFKHADTGAQGPMGSERAFLQERKSRIDLDSKVGKVQVINPTQLQSSAGAGYYCEVCECLLKDSVSYLDHINGKRHQRALGFSMRVERAGLDQVKSRIETIKRKIEDTSKLGIIPVSALDEYESKLTARFIEEEAEKKRKKEIKEAKKREQEETELANIDPEIAELMGFEGFGGKKK